MGTRSVQYFCYSHARGNVTPHCHRHRRHPRADCHQTSCPPLRVTSCRSRGPDYRLYEHGIKRRSARPSTLPCASDATPECRRMVLLSQHGYSAVARSTFVQRQYQRHHVPVTVITAAQCHCTVSDLVWSLHWHSRQLPKGTLLQED